MKTKTRLCPEHLTQYSKLRRHTIDAEFNGGHLPAEHLSVCVEVLWRQETWK